MALHPVVVISILFLYSCVAGERNLEEEFDTLKSHLEQIKVSHQNEINQLKKDHAEDIRILRQDINRCLSLTKKETVPNSPLKTETEVQQKLDNTNTVPNSKKRIRRLKYPDEVPLVPYTRSIGDASERIAFYTYLNHDMIDVGTNQIILFDHVVTNLGNLYNNTTGVFYCDRPGTYVFHVHILASPHKTVYTALTKNGERVAYIYAASEDGTYSHGGNTAILQLQRGDSIAVRIHEHQTSSGNVIDETWSSFSGFLLYPDEIEPAVVG